MYKYVGRDSVVGTANRYGLDCPGDPNPGVGEIFRICLDRPRILLKRPAQRITGLFPWDKAAEG
jgi:hypothetical protein